MGSSNSLSSIFKNKRLTWKAAQPAPGRSPPVAVKNNAFNIPNISAAPKGAVAGMAFNNVDSTYLNITPQLLHTDSTGEPVYRYWYPKSRPLKHYRKSYNNPNGKVPINSMDIPGGTIFRTPSSSQSNCINDKSSCGIPIVSHYLTKINLSDTSCSSNKQGGTCSVASQARNRVRNGSTASSKYCNQRRNYYTSSQAYLKNKCKTFDKKQMTPNYSNGNYTSGCSDENLKFDPIKNQLVVDGLKKQCCDKTIYNPCNSKFSINTATSSGNYLTNLNKTTVNKAAKYLKAEWGAQTASAAQYGSNKFTPFTTKSKYAKHYIRHKPGHKTLVPLDKKNCCAPHAVTESL